MGTSENSRTTSAPPPSPAAGLDDRPQPPQRWLSWVGVAVALFALVAGVVLGHDDARRAAAFDLAVQAAVLAGVVAVTSPKRARTIAISFAWVFVLIIDGGVRFLNDTDNVWVQFFATVLLLVQATSSMWPDKRPMRGQKKQSASTPPPTSPAPGDQSNLDS